MVVVEEGVTQCRREQLVRKVRTLRRSVGTVGHVSPFTSFGYVVTFRIEGG